MYILIGEKCLSYYVFLFLLNLAYFDYIYVLCSCSSYFYVNVGVYIYSWFCVGWVEGQAWMMLSFAYFAKTCQYVAAVIFDFVICCFFWWMRWCVFDVIYKNGGRRWVMGLVAGVWSCWFGVFGWYCLYFVWTLRYKLMLVTEYIKYR